LDSIDKVLAGAYLSAPSESIKGEIVVKKLAFLFPGQGSQSIGMGQDMHQEFDFVKEIFEMAEEISKTHIRQLCFKGPMSELTTTINLQPCITAVNLAFLAAIKKEGLAPLLCAGHSLGEYSALSAAEILSYEHTLRCVFERGGLMHRESSQYEGAMHALIGLPIEKIKDIVTKMQPQGIVSVANHNMETQIVITGDPEIVQLTSQKAVEQGARAVALKVSGAWHSELIRGAEDDFKAFLDTMDFQAPEYQVVFNVTADTCQDPEEIKKIMLQQLCSPVRWYESMQKLVQSEIEYFVEIGPGKVLKGLLRKILPKDYPAKIYNVNSIKMFERFLNDIA
jgi:[acyl-carrier-protein] S-malonyltransferase